MRRHSNFFSSLKQVEKRLKAEYPPPPPPPAPPREPPQLQQQPPPADTNYSTDSLSSPIYLLSSRQNYNSTLHESNAESEAPAAFLSQSPPFPPEEQIKNPETKCDFEEDPAEDLIQKLIEQLGLSDCGGEDDDLGFGRGGCECECEGEGGFYSKIVGVRGPKCGKEVERLEGWIGHLMRGGEDVIEPLRLAHLLVGKACFVSQGGDCGFGELEFPSTIEDFLHNDPPTN